jgi:hypothetical protein
VREVVVVVARGEGSREQGDAVSVGGVWRGLRSWYELRR